MNDQIKEESKLKNSQLSAWMIILNMILLVIYLSYGYHTDDERYEVILYVFIGLVILLGGFAFSYHGKGYNVAKWVFGVVLLLMLFLLGMMMYVTALGKAFQH